MPLSNPNKGESHSVSTLVTIICEVGDTRKETFDGVEHTVIPVVAMVEGVRQAANAPTPELALASEFGRFPIAWNGRPVTIDHPQVRGEMVSANTPTVLEDVQVGHIFNPVVEEGKLKIEAWVDEAKLNEKGIEILQKIKNKEVTEVSVGVLAEIEPIEGTFSGQKFNGIWRNVIPDHLALLSEGKIGACSVKDGCGTGRFAQCVCNETTTFTTIVNSIKDLFKLRGAKDLSDFDTRAAIQAALESLSEWGFVVAVFENSFIMETLDGTVKRSFSISEDGTIIIGNEFVTVRPETEFVEVKTEMDMTKDKKIEALISNTRTKFTDSHKKWLTGLDEEQLDLLDVPEIPKVVGDDSASTQAVKDAEIAAAALKAKEVKPKTLEQYINEAPKEIAEVLRSSMVEAERVRQDHIATIKANEANAFTDEQLDSMNATFLANLAQMSTTNDFSGRGGPRPNERKVSDTYAAEPRKLFAKAG